MLKPLSERAIEYDDLFGESLCIRLKNSDEYDDFKDYLLSNEKIVKGIESLLDEQTNATEPQDGDYFILSLVRILKEARGIPLDYTDNITGTFTEELK